MNTENLHSLSKALAYVESPFSRWMNSVSYETFSSAIGSASSMSEVLINLSTSKDIPQDVAQWAGDHADDVSVFTIRTRTRLFDITSPVFSIYEHYEQNDDSYWSQWEDYQQGCCLTSDITTWKELYDDAMSTLNIMQCHSHDILVTREGCYRELTNIQLVDGNGNILWDNEKKYRRINDLHEHPCQVRITYYQAFDDETHPVNAYCDIDEAIYHLENIKSYSKYHGEIIDMTLVMNYYGTEYPISYSDDADGLISVLEDITADI